MIKNITRPRVSTTAQNGYWERFHINNAVMTSSTSPTQTANGIQAVIPGGASTPYPGDGIWATWDLKDIFGVPVNFNATFIPEAICRLVEITMPALSTNSYAVVGITNHMDLKNAACNGFCGGAVYTGSSRPVRLITIANGAAFATLTPTALTTYSASPLSIYTYGYPIATNIYSFGAKSVISLTSTGTWTDNSIQPISLESPVNYTDTALGQGNLYFFVAFGRTDTTAGDATIEIRPELFSVRLPVLI